ncbi:hypothetical protein ASPSYDRAFT_1136438 [Aspergillus sydowii CBS 593.65]|uniref:Uncharacterized protein n=1 Tax=Aspergillus sydowii CBS 593.65 TaxID=1036612 RepID=A0A1L9TAD1_9EURO|nr:uncharacterized protein ASPSYDRAFT_1136438 [Aspergillus sydowii CBS 593.65]OJJ56374.1 hypothetical protein ASPSYDRAFT_1136438 [Aspergillus sydowii CBS 593.65]
MRSASLLLWVSGINESVCYTIQLDCAFCVVFPSFEGTESSSVSTQESKFTKPSLRADKHTSSLLLHLSNFSSAHLRPVSILIIIIITIINFFKSPLPIPQSFLIKPTPHWPVPRSIPTQLAYNKLLAPPVKLKALLASPEKLFLESLYLNYRIRHGNQPAPCSITALPCLCSWSPAPLLASSSGWITQSITCLVFKRAFFR